MGKAGSLVDRKQARDPGEQHVRRKCEALIVGLSLCLAVDCGGPEVPVLLAPRLASKGATHLLLRRESRGGGRLLITNEEKKEVYAYDPVTRSLTLVPLELWKRASGEIGGYVRTPRRRPSGPRLRIVTRGSRGLSRLFADDRRVRTEGAFVWTFGSSPKQDLVAVLSANDRLRLPSIMPFLGGGGPPSGQHYHQLFSLPDLKPVGNAKRLAIRPQEMTLVGWSADGRFVIYYTLSGNQMCIVPVEQTGS